MGFVISAGGGSAGSPLDAAERAFRLPAGKADALTLKGHECSKALSPRRCTAVQAGHVFSSPALAIASSSFPAKRLIPCGLLRLDGGWWLRRGRRVWRVVAVLLIVAVVVLVVAIAARAQVPFAPPDQDDPKARLGQIIDNLRTWLIGFLVGLATLMGTFGGLRYVLAGGDPGEVAKAKNTLRSAAIGYGIAALAPVLVSALKKIVGV